MHKLEPRVLMLRHAPFPRGSVIKKPMQKHSYVLITSARNEQDYIEATIEAVLKQTNTPKKWVLVNDGSTDRTEEIVKKYSHVYDFIENVSLGNIYMKLFTYKSKPSFMKNSRNAKKIVAKAYKK